MPFSVAAGGVTVSLPQPMAAIISGVATSMAWSVLRMPAKPPIRVGGHAVASHRRHSSAIARKTVRSASRGAASSA